MNLDDHFMEIALRLGRRNLGLTAANPSVGCVIANSIDRSVHIVGRGWTGAGGRPHAETQALERAGTQARGATAYVSLEPCAHHGKTPPCAQALVDAGVARVVAAVQDPDPRVSGKGFEMLRQAGIEVEVGLGAAQAASGLAGFFSRITKDRPHVTLKLAVSRDGKIARERGSPTSVTGPLARAHSHLLRARTDVIMIGSGTALADDPELTCRLPGMAAASPLRAVLDTSLRLAVDSKLVTSAQDVPVHIFCGPEASKERAAALKERGANVHVMDPGPAEAGGFVPVLKRLAESGAGRVLVEGGAKLAGAIVQADLADEIVLFCAPLELGADALDAVEGLVLSDILADKHFTLSDRVECGEDVMMRYVKAS